MSGAKFPRSSGILLHPTSLPARFGIGDFGPSAYRFADFLAAAGQSIWQVLPLGPTGYADSPYQCLSAFAGNPFLISPEELRNEKLLSSQDLEKFPQMSADCVDYECVSKFKQPLLKTAFRNFCARGSSQELVELREFQQIHAHWLDDFALFLALKRAHGEVSWVHWESPLIQREAGALAVVREQLSGEIEFHKFVQFLFFRQWEKLKRYCNERRIRIMGDLPIYVAHDSSDVWSHPEFFLLDSNGNPEKVAGVPPDYFSATGQLWGNPIYRWSKLREIGHQWWVERFRAMLDFFDMLRVDHFRGFEAYWEVPADETTAVHGRWTKAPGTEVFSAVQKALGDLPIVAENLGVITPEVEAIRHRFGFPGMAILQFAFGTDPQAANFRPHNYGRDTVAYTGTHDNDTTVGWWTSRAGDGSTRTREEIEQEREYVRKYLDTDGHEIHWRFIRALMASVADSVIIPLQDVLGFGSEARMNIPARISGNWRWRFRSGMLTGEIRERLENLTAIYERRPRA
jgi:4-alpha-glucanotransferase